MELPLDNDSPRLPRFGIGTVLAALALAACEPVFVFPGQQLSGEQRPVPDAWDFTDAVDVVQVETRPGDAYSVNVWGVGLGPYFYVAASDGEDARWARAIEENPQVRLKVRDDIYALHATRIADAEELARVMAAFEAKYEVEADDNFVAEAWVYRFARQ